MTPQELKASILQLAVQGKLAEQRPEEGTGEELYQRIQAKKQHLIKAGTIKKEKPLPKIAEDEIPFDIPENWKWIKLGDVVSVLGGKRIPAGRTLTKDNTGYRYIRVSDMKNGSVLTENLLYVPTDIYPSIARYVINKEDVYITVAGTIGRVGKIPPEIDGANLTENADRLVFQLLDQDWLINCLESSLIQQQIIDATTKVGQPKLAIKRIQELLLPLPPLAEQKRIVARLEELLPYIDCYEQAWSKLEDFNKRFPADMQKSILQMAIQGKLVPQLPEEGTGEELFRQIQTEKQTLIKAGKIKKEKPLPEITEDETPFDIPGNWKWARMGNIYNIHSSRRIHANEYVKEGIPFFRSLEVVSLAKGNEPSISYYISNQRYDELCTDNIMPQKGDLLITCIGGSIGWNWIVDDRTFYYKDGNVVAFDGHVNFDIHYLQSYLSSPLFKEQVKKDVSGTAYNALTIEMLKSYLIPVPPLSEQRRIVAKLEEILPLCERLK